MDKILLEETLPSVFKNKTQSSDSEIWLKDISFIRGRAYLVEAASGMGKSSLCSYIYGMRNDFEGKIFFDNENIGKLRNSEWNHIRKRSLSMMFQGLSLFDELTGFENVELKNRLTHFKSKQEISEWFYMLGIEDKLDQKVSLMSFGQRQRVALIRSLCQPFDFLILDEPISHLDNENGRIFTSIMTEEVKRQNAGLIITSIGKHPEMHYDQILKL